MTETVPHPLPRSAAGVERAAARASRDGSTASAPRRPLTSRGWVTLIGGALLPVLILAAWQVTTALGVFTIAQLPSPALVWQAGLDLFASGLLGQYAAISTQRVLIGFAVGAALGIALGALVGLSRSADVLFAPTLGAIRAVPSLAWVPLLILWLKIGEESKLTLIAIGAFFPVYTTVSAALRHVDRQLVEAGRAFGLSGVRLFTAVQLPAVIPSVVSGLRLALAQSWLFLVAAELIASSMGLGFLLIDSQNNGRIDRILLAIILLAVLGKLTDAAVGVFERWANRKWA
ncbi:MULTISPECIES: ABC transporter permease [Cryobacterium]|uniref:ABC transporter permease n=1 Tax=Cryobacterium breve TaxID=1259258 RepID=A0ABY2IWF0_9MICO|nr:MULTISPECIES: ABC transporter permease [Cryobacterium]TFC94758.1 ABC transporter permease [Cryobacterium sp. TmT3-12]TFC96352.1 ABC transporter permease [Cryobacterium breve]